MWGVQVWEDAFVLGASVVDVQGYIRTEMVVVG